MQKTYNIERIPEPTQPLGFGNMGMVFGKSFGRATSEPIESVQPSMVVGY